MTRAELYKWFLKHGCEQEALKESTTGFAVKIINRKNNYERHIFGDMPINDKPVKPYNCYISCKNLGIPIPEECKCMQELDKEIAKKVLSK